MALAKIRRVSAQAIGIATGREISDPGLDWRSGSIVLAQIEAAGEVGIGYTYAAPATTGFLLQILAPELRGRDPFDIPALRRSMQSASRNAAQSGGFTAALSAADIALWDLKAKLLGTSLVKLLGCAREEVPAYASGFETYDIDRLQVELSTWIDAGFKRVKVRIGRSITLETERIRAAREAIGIECALYVDAHGAYQPKEALAISQRLHEYDVSWFDQPVTPENSEGLRFIREYAPPGMRITGGEYRGSSPVDVSSLDALEADAIQCGGVTGFLEADLLCRMHGIPLYAGSAPSVHAQLGCASQSTAEVEFHQDHARIERMLFDGAPVPEQGMLRPPVDRPGLGLQLKSGQAAKPLLRGA